MAIQLVADAERWWLNSGEPIWQGAFDRVRHELVYRGQHGALWTIELTGKGRPLGDVTPMAYDPTALLLVTKGADGVIPPGLLDRIEGGLRGSVGFLLPRPGSFEQEIVDEVARHLDVSEGIEAPILRARLKGRGDIDQAMYRLIPRYLRITQRQPDGSTTAYGLTLPGLLASRRAEDARRAIGAALQLFGKKFDQSVTSGRMFKTYTWAELQAEGGFSDADVGFVHAVMTGADFERGGSSSLNRDGGTTSFEFNPPADLALLVEHRQVPDFLAYVDRGQGGERPGPTVPLRHRDHAAVSSDPPRVVAPLPANANPSSASSDLIDLPRGGVFISYSWDDHAHKAWVGALAARLKGDGVRVILDETHLVAGDELTLFMEQAIERSSHVLIICTPRYKEKADNRQGGVGYEESIITAKRAAGTDRKRFIPVYRGVGGRNDAPTWAQGLYAIDLRDELESEYRKLLKACRFPG